MKLFMGLLLASTVFLFLVGFPACTLNIPTLSHPNIPTYTPTPQSGTVVVNNASTGTCPVNVWLDATGPVTVAAGTIRTFPDVLPGSHNLTFTTSASMSCGSGPVSCGFNYNGVSTGTACSFYLNSAQIQTASITDNGCGLMNVICPY